MVTSPSSPTHNQPEYSVSDISQALKQTVEQKFGYVRVRGEISGFKRAGSGHLYFDLKDDKAVLNSVCWKGVAAKLAMRPEDGLEVIITGRISTYPGRSNYQMIVEAMEHAGLGALMAMLEKRKQQFLSEGLFEASRKKPLPQFPQHIGVVTSPTGAVIRDILHRISERYPVRVTLWPVRVQGEGAAEEIARAIAGFSQSDPVFPIPDLLIVARGGGSLEDLWAFNEEVVVRAAADCSIPLISAIGHETDTTLIDYVADRRAPTPTGAAEMAVPVRLDWLAGVAEVEKRLNRLLLDRWRSASQQLQGVERAMPKPSRLFEQPQQYVDRIAERLALGLPRWRQTRRQSLERLTLQLRHRTPAHHVARSLSDMAQRRDRLKRAVQYRLDRLRQTAELRRSQLAQLDYRQVLKRGFAMVSDPNGTLITSAAQAKTHPSVTLRFHDDAFPVATNPAQSKRSGKKPGNPQEQSSLFDDS